MIYTCQYFQQKDIPKESYIIDCTSRSTTWSRQLSPFFTSGGYLYKKFSSKNVENGWQYCKVHKEFVDSQLNPTDFYF